MFARESDGFNRSLGTSEHEDRGNKQKEMGSKHKDISALFERCVHAKRLFNLVLWVIETKEMGG
jgi:hypothetical protein